MKATFVAMTALAVMAGSPAIAEEKPEAAKQEKKICRTEKMTGSLTRRTRICLTADQWRELNDRNKKGLDELYGSASGSRVTPVCNSGGVGPGCV